MWCVTSTHRSHLHAVIDNVGRWCRWGCRRWEYASHVFGSKTPDSGSEPEKWISINHCNSINKQQALISTILRLIPVINERILLTARSPKFRTLQWSFADCPTVAITSRFVVLSKNGSPYCVSHAGTASPLMISVAIEMKFCFVHLSISLFWRLQKGKFDCSCSSY